MAKRVKAKTTRACADKGRQRASSCEPCPARALSAQTATTSGQQPLCSRAGPMARPGGQAQSHCHHCCGVDRKKAACSSNACGFCNGSQSPPGHRRGTVSNDASAGHGHHWALSPTLTRLASGRSKEAFMLPASASTHACASRAQARSPARCPLSGNCACHCAISAPGNPSNALLCSACTTSKAGLRCTCSNHWR